MSERRHDEDEDADTIAVPMHRLSAGALRGIVEEFVTRDGTDYGARERALEEKVADVMRQLRCGEAHIVLHRASGTVNITGAVPGRPPGRRRGE